MMASNMNTTTSHNGGLQANDEINDLYEAIYSNPDYLDDSRLILETPLHIAASAGKVHVATEIMRLKPSLAWKLNRQGQSPIHLAMQHEKYEIVLRFVEINKKLVRVKAKGGFTPLHIASETRNLKLLANFLEACPDSIEDVTGRGETALHIASKHDESDALKVLVGWLKRNGLRRAANLEKAILNWKDESGNTILHILASKTNSEMIRFAIKSGMDLNVMNVENKTALDLARSNAEMSRILIKAGAKSGEQVIKGVTTPATRLRKPITVMDRIMIGMSRMKSNITKDQRNAFFIVVTLIATTSYQTVLSPPGGLVQVSATEYYNIHANTTDDDLLSTVGTSIMDYAHFVTFFTWNTISLLVSTVLLLVLTPRVKGLSLLLFTPIGWLVMSYFYSLLLISPVTFPPIFWLFLASLLFPIVSYLSVRVKRTIRNRYVKKWGIPMRMDEAENIW